ncbi:MAG TPA: sugar phosphate nucleotidyltransferase [Methylophilaceae bacterium]|jgi:NDP-sugar pyrophosphorylase family protein
MSKRAIILAGGKGTRLRPYTLVLPKPLMPIGEFPILEVIIKQLVTAGFTHITLAVNHQAEIIKAFFMDGSKWGIRIDYSLEDKPLGTMGPLKLIKDLPDNFLVMNGDILTNLDFADFHDAHIREDEIFTISSYVREELVDYGVLETTNNQLLGLREKPRMNYEVSMGIYMMSKRALRYVPSDTAYGFDNLMHEMISAKQDVAVRKFSGYWLDIGRPDDYSAAIDIFEKSSATFLGN